MSKSTSSEIKLSAPTPGAFADEGAEPPGLCDDRRHRVIMLFFTWMTDGAYLSA
jgi:D-xylose transport system permease protein